MDYFQTVVNSILRFFLLEFEVNWSYNQQLSTTEIDTLILTNTFKNFVWKPFFEAENSPKNWRVYFWRLEIKIDMKIFQITSN